MNAARPPVLIAGASLAGLRTAESLRRNGYPGPIRALGAEPHPPYNRPPLSKDLLHGLVHSVGDLAYPLRDAVADVDWRLGRSAAALDPERRVVTDSEGEEHEYSALVIATGLAPRPLPVDAHGLRGIHVLRTIDDGLALRAELLPGAHVVVLGSGFVGCEVAAAAVKAGCIVSVVTTGAAPLDRAIGPLLAAELRRRHEAHGVRFFCGASLFGLIGADRVERVILDSGVVLDADVVVAAVGSEPNTGWLAGAGLDTSDGVLVDGAMRALRAPRRSADDPRNTRNTSPGAGSGVATGTLDGGVPIDRIWAVGDVARYPNPLFDDVPRRVEHWNLPSETGKRAGVVIAATLAGDQTGAIAGAAFAPLPSFWTDQYDAHLLSYGIPHLADRSELVIGDPAGECIVEFHRGEQLVGVCGIGLRSAVNAYRSRFAPLT